jgi:hypothetical protein
MGSSREDARRDGASSAADEVVRLLRQPGEHQVDVPIVCVITRFGLRNRRHVRPMLHDYRKVVQQVEAAQIPGFLKSAFLVEDATTFYTISLWRDMNAIPVFGTRVPIHVEMARKLFGRVSYERDGQPEVWSTKWQLVAVSNNLNWDDFDLRREVVEHCVGRAETEEAVGAS